MVPSTVLVSHKSEAETTYEVSWDGPDDVANPLNWSSARKWQNVVLVSIQATLSPMASVMLAVTSTAVTADFHQTDLYTPSLPTALFVLGFGLGPLFLAPLSELYGRRIIYLSCFTAFTVSNILCAVAPNMAALVVFRLVCGMAGSAGPSIGGGTIRDMFTPETRGRAQSVYSFGPTGGSALGGIIGSFILAGTGNWRWVLWVMAIASGITSVVSFFFLYETYPPYLLRKKARHLRASTGNDAHHSSYDSPLGHRQLLARTLTRAMHMLITAPACTAMSVYMALIYGILYLHMVTLPLLYSSKPVYGLPSYEWPAALTGLSYLGVGVGSFGGVLVCALCLNRTYMMMKERAVRKGLPTETKYPQFRIPLMQVGACIVPLGLFIFAFTARTYVHWIAPLIGAAVFSAGMLITYVCVTTYLVDSFDQYAASALAAMTLVRSIMGCIFSLIGFRLYESLGYRWGTLMLALLCVLAMPLPALFYFIGPRFLRLGGY
ncbi:uncharacterized protein TRUGW13939_02475 [Talaromyces rugulosus]|uniref:Major facilitator superfamily (MFS) profile domain-containing protein n=1 Tax=Talaromyces rugulosus TaxID=121627 RepID=A0A7H8QQF7_TALRU|nr:uncharacterized protein TRUGW13939_02475 [Talaromyces rugulosus]QKX55383.1 hypothetical protein TRUGW13939_02475 [Talaromyces rugulosus]